MRHLRLATGLLLGLGATIAPATQMRAQLSIGIVISVPPPVLPVYEQPPVPAYGYIWAPGYWAWSEEDADYYWVPGTWVLPPEPGLLWTPGFWGWNNGAYAWSPGYWGPHVGFYGGVNYGYGYGGEGYEGGYWQHGSFFYNRRANNFGNVHITNVYEHNVVNNITINRISYNGGQGGLAVRPSAQEQNYRQEHHYNPTPEQTQQQHLAASNRALFAHQNHGVPPIAATRRPGVFTAHDVEPAHNAPMAMPAQHPQNVRPPEHPQAMAPRPVEAPRPAGAPRPAEGMPPEHQAQMPHVMEPGGNRPAPQAYHAPAPQQQYRPAPQQAYHPAPQPEYRPAPQPVFHQQQEARPAGGQENRPAGGQENRPGPGHDEHKPN